MIKVGSKITINRQKIAKLSNAAIQALEMTAEDVHTKVVPYIPFDCPTEKEKARGSVGGTLSGEGTFVDRSDSKQGRVRIVSSTPYARRLYYHPEYNFDKGEHPQARGRWFDVVDGKEVQKRFKFFFKKYGGA